MTMSRLRLCVFISQYVNISNTVALNSIVPNNPCIQNDMSDERCFKGIASFDTRIWNFSSLENSIFDRHPTDFASRFFI